jgi:DNA-binding transcriptional ArsR family regulator
MDALIKVFASLGDSTRFAIVVRLLTKGALPAGELQDVADISAPAISRHLKVLREAGMITQTIDRQRRIYAVDPRVIEAIHAWTVEHKEFWQGDERR